MIYDVGDKEINGIRDPLMIIMTAMEIITIQYSGLMDKTIQEHIDRMEKASRRINKIISEIQHTDKICELSHKRQKKIH